MVATASESVRMKALVQDGSGSADVLHLREVEAPAVTDDGVLAKVHAASVNAADYHMVHGAMIVRLIGKLLRWSRPNPIRGVDVAGVVKAVGKNVTNLRPGDEVFGTGRSTARPWPPSARTARPHLRRGRRCRDVCGADREGAGAHVTAVTGTRNLDVVRPLGADELLDYTTAEVAMRDERYDVIIDVAATRSFRDLRRMLVPGGTLVCVGAAKHGGWLGILARLLAMMFRARVLHQRVVAYVASVRREDLTYLKELIEAGRLRPAIDRTYPLEEGREAVRYAMSGQGRAKVVIRVR
jgi:NADPH:quinone reductase-like Zn-dependent oxidoreductase